MKFGIAGYGSLGRVFAQAIAAAGETLTAVCALRMPCADEKFEVVDTVEQLCRTGCDCVVLALPPQAVLPAAQTVAEAGMDAVCPVPAALDFTQTAELAELFSRRGQRLIPAFVDRYYGNIGDLKRHIAEGTIGRVGVVDTTRACPLPQTPEQDWYRDEGLSGGVFWQLVLPELDLLDQVYGPIQTVYALHRKVEERDYAVLTLTGADGEFISAECLWGAVGPFQKAYEVSGTDGVLRFDSIRADSSHLVTGTPTEHFNLDLSLAFARHDPYRLFVETVAQNSPEAPTAAQLLRAARLTECAVHSAQCGQPVTVKEDE